MAQLQKGLNWLEARMPETKELPVSEVSSGDKIRNSLSIVFQTILQWEDSRATFGQQNQLWGINPTLG